MPTILRIGGLRVVIDPNDHRPAHVHVKGVGGEAVLTPNGPLGPPELRESYGLSLPAVRRVRDTLVTALAVLCAEWRKLHGHD